MTSAYQRFRDWEDDQDSVLRALMERRTEEERAPVAPTLPGDLEIDGEEFPHMASHMSRWLDDAEAGR